MALTKTERGTFTDTVAGTSFGFVPESNFTAGALAVLCVSADNSITGGATTNFSSVTDSLGNVWRSRQLSICDPGAANAGVQGGIFTTGQSAGALTTGTTITVSFGASTTAKAWALNEVTAAAGSSAIVLTGGSGAAQFAATAPTVTTGTIDVNDMVFGMVAIEGGAVVTADADTTNGNWSAVQYWWTGSSTAGIGIAVQSKLQTTTASTQTFNPTIPVARDLVCSWISVREVTTKKLSLSGVG